MSPTSPVIVVGAGPVGLASALLLSAQGRTVTVYEGRPELVLDDDNSYPIGVNPRGQEALRRIDPSLLEQLRAEGEVVEGFRILTGRRAVATLPSGTLIGTTRATLTRLLLERAQADAQVTVVTGHRLTGVTLAERSLHFERPSGEQVTVDAADALVLACDGVRSAARRSMTEQLPGFEPRIGEWGVQFRVLFSRPGASAPDMDPAWHHIFTSKGIYTATLPNQRWVVAVTAIDGDPAAELLLSRDASDANVNALRRHLERHAPLAAPLLTTDDCRAYFAREPFGGAVVRCPRLAVDEWLLLMGDAAHSVIPPTGEGVNSGLEDAFLLAEHLASGSATPLADFEEARLPDLHALGEYAWTLKDNIANRDPARSATNVALRIAGAVAARAGRTDAQVEQRLFGPDAGLTPYREAIGPWIAFRDRWTPRLAPVVGGVARAITAGVPGRPGGGRSRDRDQPS